MARKMVRWTGAVAAVIVAVVLVASLVVGSGGSDGDSSAGSFDGGMSSVDVGAGRSDRSPGRAEGSLVAAPPREVIRTGDLSVVTDDVDRAVRRAERLAAERGAFVESEEATSTDVGAATITYRVPADEFAALLRDLAALGDVEARRVTTDDVHDEGVDLDARITSAQRSVDRVRSFLDDARNVGELASVEAELLRRETELEQLTAQRRSLSDRVALATVRLTVTTQPSVAPALDPLRKVPGFGGALADGVGALVSVARLVGAGVGYALPFVVVVGVPLLALRAIRRRRSTPPEAPAVA